MAVEYTADSGLADVLYIYPNVDTHNYVISTRSCVICVLFIGCVSVDRIKFTLFL